MKTKVVSKIAVGRKRKSQVMKGKFKQTKGGLRAVDLTKNQYHKIVNKKRRAFGQKNAWMAAVKQARKALGVTGFVAIKKGTALYKKAKELYAPMDVVHLGPGAADPFQPADGAGEQIALVPTK